MELCILILKLKYNNTCIFSVYNSQGLNFVIMNTSHVVLPVVAYAISVFFLSFLFLFLEDLFSLFYFLLLFFLFQFILLFKLYVALYFFLF